MKRRTIGFQQLLTLVTVLLSAVVLLFVGLILYRNTAQYFEAKLYESEQTSLRQLGLRLDTHFDKLVNMADAYADNPAIRAALERLRALETEGLGADVYAYSLVSNEFIALMRSLQECYDGVESMILITAQRSYVQGASTLLAYDWEALAANAQAYERARLIRTDETTVIGDMSLDAVYIGSGQTAVLRWIGGAGEPALLVIRLSANWLREQLQAQGAMTLTYDGMPAIGNGLDGAGADMTQTLALDGWTLHYQSNQEHFMQRSQFTWFFLAFFGICCLLTFLLCRLLMRRVVDPLMKIADTATHIAQDADWNSATLAMRRTRYTLCERIMMLFLLSILMPMLLFSLSYSANVSGLFIQEMQEHKANTLSQTAENLNVFLRNKVAEAKLIAFDTTVQEALVERAANPDSLPPVEAVAAPYLMVMERYYAVTLRDIHNQVVYAAPADISLPMSGEAQPLTAWGGLRTSRSGIPLISMRMNIYGVAKPGGALFMRNIGSIQVDVETQVIQALFRDVALLEDMQLYLLDASGQVLTAREAHHMGQHISHVPLGDVQLSLPIEGSDWTLMGNFDQRSLEITAQSFLLNQIPMLLLIIFALFLVAFELSHLLTAPLWRMGRLLQRVQLLNVDIHFPETERITEVHRIATAFNAMIARVNRLLDEAVASLLEKEHLQREKEAAEHVALQAQINPHFICNALEMARCLIDDGKPEEAAHMMRQINHLFRYGISRQENVLTVKQELLYAKAYAAILTLRFPDKLRFEWDVDDVLLPYPTVKMILQPLLENAFEHGIMPRKQPGCIRVTGRMEGDSMRFCVADDGVGLEEAQLAALRARLHEGRQEGIGLANLTRRLALSYGEAASLQIESVKWQGTCVSLTIPLAPEVTSENQGIEATF